MNLMPLATYFNQVGSASHMYTYTNAKNSTSYLTSGVRFSLPRSRFALCRLRGFDGAKGALATQRNCASKINKTKIKFLRIQFKSIS